MTGTRNTARGRAAATVLALALALPLAGASGALAAPSAPDRTTAEAPATRPELPRPTGKYAVGRDTLHLVDKSRKDLWDPTKPRELMASVYYPASGEGGRATAYTSLASARALITYYKLDVSPAAYSSTRTYARAGAPAARGRFPLVLLSPGFTAPRSTLTHLAEDLASRGYVVATVDHAHEAAGGEFEGGRMPPCLGCDPDSTVPGSRITENRAQDLSYVLDRLVGGKSGKAGESTEGAEPAWRRAKMIDPERIGSGGHSIGGAATMALMNTDRRVRAGTNMDGGIQIKPEGLRGRPFLMLGTQQTTQPDDPYDWAGAWPLMDGWKRWLAVAGSGHFTFTDAPVVLQQLGDVDPDAPISGKRSAEITRAYIGAFYDQHLRGIKRPLLEGPTPGNPEVTFHQP
ncbi:alpha/beta hydrolase family protein [Streptomyces spectabilis]|uniref:Alpha/beta hydrolase n=1 Tax=Streptomyces spectabilis TaxID=68270 RepID=A0A5P2X9G5_STRST|nr:alpha/beta hydrolase [Streptomyces spectabilis]MBB5108570.1 dienelactone hydrolase [Streptomyces spectabilis]MCI3901785.1 alpha/beta hydrolase [Streptomyces spectabilis]QEV59216.1 alpha/beta hydrolase [Streptomyces spectabilis]GGV47134.1 lipase [Streptomyces spectabilis]